MKIHNIITIILFGSLIDQSREQCVLTSRGGGLPAFFNYGEIVPRITRQQQAIIPSYELTCCGNITKWGVDVRGDGRGESRRYTIDFQVWRPSPTTPQDDTLGAGYYSLVGYNRFSTTSLANPVIEVTPSPQDHIQFRPGDVLGLYVEETLEITDGVVVFTDSSGNYTREVVWYASANNVSEYTSTGLYGNLNNLLRGAPIVSISTSTTVCPSTSLTTAATTATSLPTPSNGPSSEPTTSEPDVVQTGLIVAVVILFIVIVILLIIGVVVYRRRSRTPQGNNANLEQTNPIGAGNAIMLMQEATATTDQDMHDNPAYIREEPVTTATNDPSNNTDEDGYTMMM